MNRKDRITVISGTFDPLTIEDLNFIKRCRKKGDLLVVGIHSNWWMAYTQGGYLQDFETRSQIVKSLKYVDEIFTFNDTDGTVCQLLKLIKICYPNSEITYVSQEDMHNMPETKIRGITFETMK
jgi:glycerol-3-phosphate cytidylyltransferase-like family protein